MIGDCTLEHQHTLPLSSAWLENQIFGRKMNMKRVWHFSECVSDLSSNIFL